jgi:hypothetical protein
MRGGALASLGARGAADLMRVVTRMSASPHRE